jgi:hypothetical protein
VCLTYLLTYNLASFSGPNSARARTQLTQCGLAIYIKKYLKAKEELWKLKYFTMQKYNLKKKPLKETLILQDIIITLL